MDFLSVAFLLDKKSVRLRRSRTEKNTNDEKKLVVIFTGKPEY